MHDPAHGPVPKAAFQDRLLCLQSIVDRMQTVRWGNPEIDAGLEEALEGMFEMTQENATWGVGPLTRGVRWSTDLGHALGLVPPDHDFSLGNRDGVCWAWIQPNDQWQPGEYDARHDHPAGSGLVVAATAALALTCAAVNLQIRRMERQGAGQ